MKMVNLLSSLLILLTSCYSNAADAPMDSELKRIGSVLQPVLAKLEPKPEISQPSGTSTLLVTYKAQNYKIHGRSMSGEISPEAHDELGPTFKGFVLQVHLQEKGEINQAVTPQTLEGPYWKTDLDVAPLAGSQKQIYWALSYGRRTDTELLTKIRQSLRDLKDAEPTAPGKAPTPAR